MKPSKLQSPFLRRKIITYASDGNTAIKENKDLQKISGNLYRGQDDVNEYNQVSCRIYIFYEDIGIGMDIGSICDPDEKDISKIPLRVPPAFLYGSQAFIEALDYAVENEQHITNAQIALASYITPNNVAVYIEARQRALDRDDERRAMQQAKREAEDAAYCEKCNAETQSTIDAALGTIRTGGILKNDTLNFYHSRYDCRSYSVINHLARQYGVNFPLKVQGWVNKNLTQVKIHNNEAAGYWCSGGKSATFLGYMGKLVDAVLREDAKGGVKEATAEFPAAAHGMEDIS